MRLLSITLARITTVRFCVNDTGEAMRTSPYLPFAKSIVPLALSILLVTASPPRGRYWYAVDTPDLEPLHSILISRHPVWGWLYGAGRRDGLRHVARARKHAAKDELHGRRARPDRVYRGEGLEPQQEDSRNAAIKCAKVQTLNRVQFETRRFQFRSSPPWATLEGWYYGFQTGRGLVTIP